MKIRLVMFGRTRRGEIGALVDDYIRRIGRYTKIEVNELRQASPAGLRKLGIEPGAATILLDAGGDEFSSAQFARWLGELRDRGTRELLFFCGDASGFSDEIRAAVTHKISLSRFTLPHELARVVLAEQIYRALATLAGHPYPK